MTQRSDNKPRLRAALGVTLVFMLLEIAVGLWSGSLALVADAGHMLTDAGALALSLLVAWLAEKPPTPRRTFGYRRTEILAALGNGLALWVMVGIVAVEAAHRFARPAAVQSGPMLWVAVAGLVANLAVAAILKPKDGDHGNLNVKGAYLHVLVDSWSSVGVIVAAIVIARTGDARADPVASLLICALVLYSSWGLVRESVMVLLEASPAHLDAREIETALRGVRGVTNVHDLHVWTVTSGFDLVSGHLAIDAGAQHQAVLVAAQGVLRERFGIDHSTIQIEDATAGNGDAPGDHRHCDR